MTPKKSTKKKSPPLPDTKMSRQEKEKYIEEVEELEGPDRREKHGSETREEHEPGVARS